MRNDVILSARLAGCALGALAIAACSSMMSGSEAGATSVAPAVSGENSSATAPVPPASDHAPPPQTDVTEQKTGPH